MRIVKITSTILVMFFLVSCNPSPTSNVDDVLQITSYFSIEAFFVILQIISHSLIMISLNHIMYQNENYIDMINIIMAMGTR